MDRYFFVRCYLWFKVDAVRGVCVLIEIKPTRLKVYGVQLRSALKHLLADTKIRHTGRLLDEGNSFKH